MKQIHPVFNVVKLTLAPDDPILGRRMPPPPPLEIIDREEEWVVEDILDSKLINRTSIGNTQEPRDTSGWQNFFPSLSNPPSCRDIMILKGGGGCQRTPQSDSHYSRYSCHLRQSPIHPSTQTTEPPPAARDLTVVWPTCPAYMSGLCVQPTCPTYMSDLRV